MVEASLYPSVVAISHVVAISVLSTPSSNTHVELEWRLTVRMCLCLMECVPMFQAVLLLPKASKQTENTYHFTLFYPFP